jgi:hypothetical protein
MFNDRASSRLERKMRDLAESGTLMIGMDQIYKFKLNC